MNVSSVTNSALLNGISAAPSGTQTGNASFNGSSISLGASTTFSDSISLTPEAIDLGLGVAPSTAAVSAGKLFSFLNLTILDYNSVAGVGSAIDAYTKALPGSIVYDSPYTTPSAKFLGDLANLKSAAAAGDLSGAQTILAQAKLAAPDDVAGGETTARSRGDIAGEAALVVEAAANTRNYLIGQGYSSKNATAEAIALQLNSLSESAADATSSSSAQTRIQQITDIAASESSAQLGVPPTSKDALINIFQTLLGDTSALATDESLASLDALYGSNTSTTAKGGNS